MNDSNVGNWNWENGKYGKTCPVCQRQFEGRKNQIYCGVKCKARMNNDLAAKKTRSIAKHTHAYLRNIEVLASEYQKDGKDVAIVSLARLKILGFDPQAPYVSFAWNKQPWHKVGDYAFRLLPKEENKSQQIEISKMK